MIDNDEDFITDPEAGAKVEPVEEEPQRPPTVSPMRTHPTSLEGYEKKVQNAMRQVMGLDDEEQGDDEGEKDPDQ